MFSWFLVLHRFVGNGLAMYTSSLKILISVGCLALLILLFLPNLLYVILCFNLVILLGVSYLKIRFVLRTNNNINYPLSKVTTPPIFISIQIPICSEPVDSVLKTIKAAANQTYDHFEVLVLYNNTIDQSLIDPVEKYCATMENVQFFNRNNIAGYKAGALNVARKLMNHNATHILTLDADYILNADGLEVAAREFQAHHIDVLQFPQSYCNHTEFNSLAAEFNHYFRVFSQNGNKYHGSLPTGTLTLISVECIDIIGGWPEKSITEDAFLGVELLRQGCLLSYSDTIIGRGKMPSSIKDLKQQRMRWIFGNFQTLVHAIKFKGRLGLKIGGTLAQLTSWINLMGLPIIALSLLGFISALLPSSIVLQLYTIAIISLTTHVLTQVFLFYKSSYRGNTLLNALLTNIATGVDGAFVWWGYLFNKERPFTRTNKFSCAVGNDPEAIIITVIFFLNSIMLFVNHFDHLGYVNWFLAIIFIAARIELNISLKDANNVEKRLAL